MSSQAAPKINLSVVSHIVNRFLCCISRDITIIHADSRQTPNVPTVQELEIVVKSIDIPVEAENDDPPPNN
jgi:hypothetical protein